jgi:flagellar hook-associated protein 1 FlgK
MSGLNDILEVGRRALTAQRLGIDVASHNISNASTPGYSRQRLQLAASDPAKETFGLLGTGVMAEGIQRIRADFIDQQIRSTNYNLGEASQQQQILSQIEATVNEPSDTGLGSMITKFFGSFQDLSLHPEDAASRNTVVQAANMLNDTFHRVSSSLQQLKGDLVLDVQSRVDQINRLVKDIYDANTRITSLESNGIDANDARDLRDNNVGELSKLVDVKVTTDSAGGMSVSIGGTQVASRTGYGQLATQSVAGQLKIVTQGAGTTVDVKSGEVGGILQTLNTTIPAYLGKLDDLASATITRVNALHQGGFGIGNPPPTGNSFFAGSDAQTIDLSAAIKADMNNIAASSDGAAGNNDVAISISRVPGEMLMSGGSATISQFYNGLVSDVGATIQSATNSVNSQQLVQKQLENQRSSVAGVSIDEEMVDLIKFQRGFDAAAKVINTVNEMYTSLLTMV